MDTQFPTAPLGESGFSMCFYCYMDTLLSLHTYKNLALKASSSLIPGTAMNSEAQIRTGALH